MRFWRYYLVALLSCAIGWAGGLQVAKAAIEELATNRGPSIRTIKAESDLAACRDLNQEAVERQATAVCGLRTRALDALLSEASGPEEQRRAIRNACRVGLEDAIATKAEEDAAWREIERVDRKLSGEP